MRFDTTNKLFSSSFFCCCCDVRKKETSPNPQTGLGQRNKIILRDVDLKNVKKSSHLFFLFRIFISPTIRGLLFLLRVLHKHAQCKSFYRMKNFINQKKNKLRRIFFFPRVAQELFFIYLQKKRTSFAFKTYNFLLFIYIFQVIFHNQILCS